MKIILPKPKGLAPEYGAQLGDASIARAYPTRPVYAAELFDLLHSLVRDTPSVVLDFGCGTGDICRPLAPLVDHIDAVDPSRAMITLGRELPGGQHPRIHWAVSSAEDFSYPKDYTLVIAAFCLRLHPLLHRRIHLLVVYGRPAF